MTAPQFSSYRVLVTWAGMHAPAGVPLRGGMQIIPDTPFLALDQHYLMLSSQNIHFNFADCRAVDVVFFVISTCRKPVLHSQTLGTFKCFSIFSYKYLDFIPSIFKKFFARHVLKNMVCGIDI